MSVDDNSKDREDGPFAHGMIMAAMVYAVADVSGPCNCQVYMIKFCAAECGCTDGLDTKDRHALAPRCTHAITPHARTQHRLEFLFVSSRRDIFCRSDVWVHTRC